MILVINSGSSSIKYKIFQSQPKLEEVSTGSFDGVSQSTKEFEKAANVIYEQVSLYKEDIKFIAYRIVHNGGKLKDGVRATDSVVDHIKEYDKLAPLHNLRAAFTIQSFKKVFPKSSHICFFDTTFYEELPEYEAIYPLQKEISQKFNLKRFGFHGISHQYAYKFAKARYVERVLTIHLGAGCSITAIRNGKPVATSMGYTPLSGLVMQTRCGDIDPGLVLYLCELLGDKGANDLLSKRSGLSGLTGSSGEMLDILYLSGERIEDKNYTPSNKLSKSKESYKNAKLALDIYCNSIIKYIGAYSALMGGIDRIIFTGKIGYGSSVIRRKVLSRLKYLKIEKVNIVDPNEELAIAEKVMKMYEL